MDKNKIINSLKTAKESSPKRNFKQTVDLIINLKDVDLKKPDQQVNTFVQLPFSRGKKLSICALTAPDMLISAKEACDEAISIEDFPKYDKKSIKKLAEKHDFFMAQATIMPKVAAAFGRVLGPRGKMPNPKAGCVFPPAANLKQMYEKLQKTAKVATKNDPIVQCAIGKEDSKDEEIADNAM